MNDLIQSLPSPSLTAGITHIWMGESWMVDGEMSMMMMKISSKSPSLAGCQNGVSGSESRFLMVAAQRNSIWEKHRTPDSFRSGGICRRKEGSRRWPRRPHHPLAQPSLAHATRGCEPLVAPLRLVFWLHGSSGKIGFLQYFLGFFLKVGFLHKNKTPGQFCSKQR
jgi:hypothetical protein